jgi:hypothetical protein
MPMQTEGTKLSIPEYWECWSAKTIKQINPLKRKEAQSLAKQFISNKKGECVKIKFTGNRIAIVGESTPHGGYARVVISDKKGKILINSFVDFYSKVTDKGVRFISPQFPQGDYTLVIEVTDNHPVWYKKDGTRFGSDEYFVSINDIIVL